MVSFVTISASNAFFSLESDPVYRCCSTLPFGWGGGGRVCVSVCVCKNKRMIACK
jgi:hypothetical protein